MNTAQVIDLCKPSGVALLGNLSNKQGKKINCKQMPSDKYIKTLFLHLSSLGFDIKEPGDSLNYTARKDKSKLKVLPYNEVSNTKIHSQSALIEYVKQKPYYKEFMKAIATKKPCIDKNQKSIGSTKRKRGRPRKNNQNIKGNNIYASNKVVSQRLAENIKKRTLEKIALELYEFHSENKNMLGKNRSIKDIQSLKNSKLNKKEESSILDTLKNTNKVNNDSNSIIKAIVDAAMIRNNTCEFSKIHANRRIKGGCHSKKDIKITCKTNEKKVALVPDEPDKNTLNQCIEKDNFLNNFQINSSVEKLNKNLFKCLQCKRPFLELRSLICHMKIHSNDKPYICSICFDSFVDKLSYKYHTQLHKESNEYICTMCLDSFSSYLLIEEHIDKCDKGKNSESYDKSSFHTKSAQIDLYKENESATQSANLHLCSNKTSTDKYHAEEVSSEYLMASNSYEYITRPSQDPKKLFEHEQNKLVANLQKSTNQKCEESISNDLYFANSSAGYKNIPSEDILPSNSLCKITSQSSYMERDNHTKDHNIRALTVPTMRTPSISMPQREDQYRLFSQQNPKSLQDHHRYIQEMRKYQEPQRYLHNLRKFQENVQQSHHNSLIHNQSGSATRSSAPDQITSMTSSIMGAFTQHLMGSNSDVTENSHHSQTLWSANNSTISEFPPGNISWGGSTMWGQGNFSGYR